MTMTKRELVIRVANKLGMTQSDVARIIEGTFETISSALAEGKRWNCGTSVSLKSRRALHAWGATLARGLKFRYLRDVS